MVVEMMGLEPTTPCLQSRIGRCCHLRGRGTAQAEAASRLSVVVRSGPFRTAVNGTLVARPARDERGLTLSVSDPGRVPGRGLCCGRLHGWQVVEAARRLGVGLKSRRFATNSSHFLVQESGVFLDTSLSVTIHPAI